MPEARNHNPCQCGCGAGGRGRKAVGVDPALKAANLVRLKRAQGQVGGVLRMVEEDRYCADIITQINAVRESLHAVARNLLRNHLAHCAAAAMQEKGAERDRMIDELVDLVGKISR